MWNRKCVCADLMLSIALQIAMFGIWLKRSRSFISSLERSFQITAAYQKLLQPLYFWNIINLKTWTLQENQIGHQFFIHGKQSGFLDLHLCGLWLFFALQIEFFLLSQNKKNVFFLRRSGPSVTVFQKPSFFIAITFHVKFNNTSKMSNALRKKQWTIMWLGSQLTVTEIVFSKYQMDIVNVRLPIAVRSAQFVDGLVTRKIEHAIQFTIMFWMRNEFKVSVRCQV